MKQTIAFYSASLYRDFYAYSTDALSELGLSYPSLPFILYVGRFPRCTPIELASALHLEWGRAQRSITRLVDAGFILKEKEGRGKRVYHLTLTESGARAFELSHQVFLDWDERVLSSGALCSTEQAQLRRLLNKLVSSIGSTEQLPIPEKPLL